MAHSITILLLAAYPVAIVGICRSFGMQGFAAVLVVTAVLGQAEHQRKIAKEKFDEFSQTFKAFSGNLQELSWMLQAYTEGEVQQRLSKVNSSDLKAQCSRLGLGETNVYGKEELVQIIAKQAEKGRDLDLDQIRF